MVARSKTPSNVPKKPSKLLAFLALVVAFSLPFILVKTFPHKDKSVIDSIPLTLPVIQDGDFEEEHSDDAEEAENISDDAKTANEGSSSRSSLASDNIKASPSKNANLSQKQEKSEAKGPQKGLSKTENLNNAAALNAKPQDDKQAHGKAPQSEWTVITIKNKDTMGGIFSRLGLDAGVLSTILHEVKQAKALVNLRLNQEFRFLIKNKTLEKMVIPYGNTQFITIYRDGSHYKTKIQQRKMDARTQWVSAVVNGSLYTTARRANVPSKLIRQMTEIFTWDINFAKDIKAGDQFSILYKAFYIDKKLVDIGDIIAVSYKNNGETFEAVRYTNRAGRVEYFTPQGKSLKKAFTRYPLRFSHIGSPFSLSRYHPILHYARAHKGVDLAARIGTPIQATGDGRIEIIGSQNGYGNMIKIKHNKTYSTVYGHMLKFQKGLRKGSFVKRGQVIGFVGQTGLASGPHCHYEIHINNQAKNPATVTLPRGDPIGAREMARFKANTGLLLAELHKSKKTQLAKR